MALALDSLGQIRDPIIRRNFEVISREWPAPVAAGGGGGGAPSGPAGGDLTGTYPNPGIASLVIVNGDISATAAIARAKLDFGSGLVDADIASGAAIAESKLALATDAAAGVGSRRTLGTGALQAAAGNDSRLSDSRAPNGSAGGDLSGSYPNPQIATGVIVDADVNAAAAIAESKLNLATDAAAGTGSRRTLGTTATSAAAGNRGLPVAGTTGQFLTKNSNTDYDVGWSTASGGSPSGAAGGDLAGTYPNPTLAARVYWMLRLTAATGTIAASGGTLAIAWTQEDADPFGIHAASATTVTPARAGVYLVGFLIFTGASNMSVKLQKNSTDNATDIGDISGTTAGGQTMYQASGLMTLTATDTLRVLVTNSTASTQSVAGNTTNYQAAKFWGYWIGP